MKESNVTHGSKEQVIQRLREQAALGAPGGGTQGDCVTIEGSAPPSPADPGGQAEGLERPKAEEQAEEFQTLKEEVDWSEDEPQEPKKRRKIRRSGKMLKKAEKDAAKKATEEAKKKAKEEADKELPKAELAHSAATDLQAEWDSGNEDSEGEYASLSSTECHDPEPTFLKPTAKQKAVRPKPTAKTSSRLRLKSVQKNPIRLRSAVRLRSVTKGIRPDRHPFVKLINLKGKVGPRYSRPVSHQPTTTRRPGCIDSETGIEHRLSDSGRWLPVL